MSELYNQQPRELNWDDPISQEEMELPHLPDGDYPFQIVNLEKARHQPRDGGKLPPCNKAILTVRVTDRMNNVSVDIRHNLFLHTSMEWKLSEFFAAIGLKQKGEALRMDWSRVIGATGLCKVKKQERRDGRAASEIDRFYPAYDLPPSAITGASPALATLGDSKESQSLIGQGPISGGAAPQRGYQQPAQSYATPVAPVTYGQPQQGYASPQQPNGGNSFTPGRF